MSVAGPHSNTSIYSMSKSVSTTTDLSDDNDENIIYADINDLRNVSEQLDHVIQNNSSQNYYINSFEPNIVKNDIYATVNRKTKSSKLNTQNIYYENVLSRKNERINTNIVFNVEKQQDDLEESTEILESDIKNYSKYKKYENTDKLESLLSNSNIYSSITPYMNSANMNINQKSKYRSLSCKNLTDNIYRQLEHEYFVSNRIDSPITRYDSSVGNSMQFLDRSAKQNSNDFYLKYGKVYSSSYPGTTGSLINSCKNEITPYQCGYSQEDVSQDSYELLERSHDHFYSHLKSCSLDSGNYLTTDDESEEKSKYLHRYAHEGRSKSASDILIEGLNFYEDPRYFPKEKMCIRSDGNFYNKLKIAGDFQDNAPYKNSESSKKDTLYSTEIKQSVEISKSKSESGISSPESKNSYGDTLLTKNYEMPATTGKLLKGLKCKLENNAKQLNSSKQSLFFASNSFDSEKGDSEINDEFKSTFLEELSTDIDANIPNTFYNDINKQSSTFPSKNNKTQKNSHVHSISLQNVQIDRNQRSISYISSDEINVGYQTKPIKSAPYKTAQIWPEQSEIMKTSNVFCFEKDRIESLTRLTENLPMFSNNIKKNINYPLTPELLSEFDKQSNESAQSLNKKSKKEELIAKTHFEEYNPKVMIESTFQKIGPLGYAHAIVERTKSDPNSLADRPKFGASSRRHTLIHQKSIDLTPAESSEDEYLYKQIPSAPPVCRTVENVFDLSSKHLDPVYDCSRMENIPSTGYEMPKSFFKDGERKLVNNINEDIPYVLHKRHIMNGTAPTSLEVKSNIIQPKSPKSPISPKMSNTSDTPKSLKNSEFLFTQNIDLSKVNPITLEVVRDSEILKFCSSKVDITQKIDSVSLEVLNKKLKQIDSDSATSSRSEDLEKRVKLNNLECKLNKKEFSNQKKINKLKQHAHKAKSVVVIRKGKTRITSFSSDDESIDSDDVFGSAEAVPTQMEFSPPQSRKDIEPILVHEQTKMSLATWARTQTMSSTEVEGSPPQIRRLADFENRYHVNTNSHAELRRISERSISLHSSDAEYDLNENKADTKQNIMEEMKTPSKNIDNSIFLSSNKSSRVKLLEEIIDSSIILRSKNQAAILFAHARLNLSEGSACATLQRQKATESPRRTKSLDNPVISLHRLPPMNTFSAQDDTVAYDEEPPVLEIKSISEEKLDGPSVIANVFAKKIIHSDINVDEKHSNCKNFIIDREEVELLDKLKYIQKVTLQGVKIKDKQKLKTKLKSGNQLILDIPKYKFEPFSSGNSSRKTSPNISRANSIEIKSRTKTIDTIKSPKSLALEIKSKEKKMVKIKDKSTEKIENTKRMFKKSLEENEIEQVKRQERQQKLYEIAIKQTINMISPTKEHLTFASSLENNALGITQPSNVVLSKSSELPEDQVLIAKASNFLSKVTRSFEADKSIEKLDKANRSFEDRDGRAMGIETSLSINSVGNIDIPQLSSPDEPLPNPTILERTMSKGVCETKNLKGVNLNVWTHEHKSNLFEKRAFSQPEAGEIEAVIFERRNLDLLKRQSLSSDNHDGIVRSGNNICEFENTQFSVKIPIDEKRKIFNVDQKDKTSDNSQINDNETPLIIASSLNTCIPLKSTSFEEESSQSLSVSRPFGISNDLHEQKRNNMLLNESHLLKNTHNKKSPTLEKQYTLDFGSGSDADLNNTSCISKPGSIAVEQDSKPSKIMESKYSLETDSGSSGSFFKVNDNKRSKIESSSSSSFEDHWNPRDTYHHFDYDNVDCKKKSEEIKQSEKPDIFLSRSKTISPCEQTMYITNYPERALSRISEKSSNSEKSNERSSSQDDNSVNEFSSDHQMSLSSEHSGSNIPSSDCDRRTSTEMPDIPCDNLMIQTLSDMYKKKVNKEDTKQFEIAQSKIKKHFKEEMIFSSQDSEDWPLPDVPGYQRGLGCKMSNSFHSDSENWPSPPSSLLLETPKVDNIETFFLCEKQEAKAINLCFSNTTIEDDSSDPDYAEAGDPTSSKKTSTAGSPINSFVLPYESTYYLSEKVETESANCFSQAINSSHCFRFGENVDGIKSFVNSNTNYDTNVILTQPKKKIHSSSDLNNDFTYNDEVFLASNLNETSNCRRCSHNSYSEDDTSSVEGTVKVGFQQKCTHSSHSEDTSIGLSISEWSTSTTVRQYGNLSGSDSLSAVSNNSSYVKNEKKLQDIPKCEIFSNSSDTEKLSSGPKSDEITLTLTEIPSATSSSYTLITDTEKPFKAVKREQGGIDYVSLNPSKLIKRQNSIINCPTNSNMGISKSEDFDDNNDCEQEILDFTSDSASLSAHFDHKQTFLSHQSYHDKTLSKSQIRDYKNEKYKQNKSLKKKAKNNVSTHVFLGRNDQKLPTSEISESSIVKNRCFSDKPDDPKYTFQMATKSSENISSKHGNIELYENINFPINAQGDSIASCNFDIKITEKESIKHPCSNQNDSSKNYSCNKVQLPCPDFLSDFEDE